MSHQNKSSYNVGMDASLEVMAQDTVMASAMTTMQADSVHKVYAEWISAELNSREDLVIDFSCLQMCLDPQSELSLFMQPEGEKVCTIADDLSLKLPVQWNYTRV